MEKIKNIFATLSVIFALPAISLFLIEKYTDYSFLFGGINGKILVGILASCAAVFLLTSCITAILSKKEKRIVLNSVLRILTVCIIGYIAFISVYDYDDCKYYEFASPDGKYTVVAEEWSFLMGGGVVFYGRVNPLFVEYKEGFSTDDGYRAISSGDYSVEWKDNIMSITLQDGNRNYKTKNIIL